MHARLHKRPEAATDTAARAESLDGGIPLRILIVDDNVDAADTLAMLLDTTGHITMVEHSACGGLVRARAETPDVCLLDIGLPDMDGNTSARQLRNLVETRDTVLVAVTGYGQQRDRDNTQAAGFDYHLVKPVDIARLLEILDQPTAKRAR